MIQRFNSQNWSQYHNNLQSRLSGVNDLEKTNIFLGKPENAQEQLDTVVKILDRYRNHIEYVRLFGTDWLEIDRKNISAIENDYELLVYEGFLWKVFKKPLAAFTVEYRPQSQWWLWNCPVSDHEIQSALIKDIV